MIDCNEWRVAVLNHSEKLEIENIEIFERHNETDEVFILLSGRCILFIGEGDDEIGEIFAEDMQPLKIYNVKKARLAYPYPDYGGYGSYRGKSEHFQS